MNKKGFTLVELLAVLVLLGLISLLIYPSIRNLMKNNNEKEYNTYKDLMVSYAKSLSINDKNNGFVCLNKLKNNGLKDINSSMECNGYVIINNNNYTPYLLCIQDGNEVYHSENYDISKCG